MEEKTSRIEADTSLTDGELEAHLKVITDLLADIKKVQDRHETNTDKEIGDLHDFTLKVAELSAKVDTIHSGQKRVAERTADAVEDAIEPVTKQTKKLEATIKTKRSIAFKAPKRFLFWKRGE